MLKAQGNHRMTGQETRTGIREMFQMRRTTFDKLLG